MPEEITQKLGFEATKAIQTLTDLKTCLDSFKTSLKGAADAARDFNTRAGPAAKTMRDLAKAANSAATAAQKLSGAMGASQASVAQTGKGLQTTATAAQNLSGMYTQAVAGMGISTQNMANQVTSGTSKASSSMTKTGSAMNQAGRQVQQSAKAAGNATTVMGNQMTRAGQQGAQAAKTMTLSWKTVLRVIQAQLIIRAFSGIIQAMKAAANSAIEFQLAVAEVQTIAPPTLGNLDQLAAKIREVSLEFGVTQQIAAEGVYQILSNQVVEASQAFDFFTTAQRLATVTLAETRDAVNALSSVINSYQLHASEAERISGTLFKTVELGRLRLNEIADIIGRVTPLTAELGIEWEEVAASLAVMTRQGVRANTAITQMRAIVLKLIKPTEQMQGLFRQWGVRDAEQAIQKFGGLVGLLQKLAQETDGSSAEMAQFFNRVRAIAGVLGVMTGEGEEVAETLDKIRDAATASTEAFEKFTEAPAFRIQRALTAIQVTFEELASKALPVLADMLEWIVKIAPAADTMAQAFKYVGIAIVELTKVGALFVVSMVEGLATIVGWVEGVAQVIGDLFSGVLPSAESLKQAFTDTSAAAEQMMKEIEAEEERFAKQWEDRRKRMMAADKKFWQEQSQNAWNFLSEISLVWQRMEVIVDAGIESVTKITSRMWDNVIADGKDAIKGLADLQDNFQKKMRDHIKETSDMRERFAEEDFKHQLDRSQGLRKDQLLSQRVDEILAQSRKDLAKAGIDEEKYRHALETTHRAQELARERAQHALEMGNRGAEYQAMKQLSKARRAEEKAREAHAKAMNRANTQEAQRFRDDVERRMELMDELRKNWTDIQKELAKQEDSNSERSAQLRENLTEVERQMRKNLFNEQELRMAEALGADRERLKAFNEGVQEVLTEAKFAWETEVARLQAILDRTVFKLKADFGDIGGQLSQLAQEVLGRARLPYEDPGQYLGKAFDQAREALQRYKPDQIEIQELTEKIGRTTQNVKNILDEVTMEPWVATSELLAKLSVKHRGDLKAMHEDYRRMGQAEIDRYNNLEQQIRNVANALEAGVDVSNLNLDSLKAQIDKEVERGRLTETNANKLKKAVDHLTETFDEAGKKKELIEKWDDTPLQAMQALVGELGTKTDEWAKKIEASGTTTDEVGTKTDAVKSKVDVLKGAHDNVTGAMGNQVTKYDTQLQKLDQLIAKERERARAAAGVPAEAGAPTAPGAPGAPTEPAAPTPEAIPQQVEKIDQSLSLLTQKINEVSQAVPALGTAFGQITSAVSGVAQQVTLVKTGIDSAITSTASLWRGWDTMSGKVAAVAGEPMSSLINATNNAKTATDNLKTSWDSVAQSIGVATSAAGQAAAAMQQAAQAAAAAAQACAQAAAACAGGSVGAAHGGRYFQVGGRGTDQIPAWLTPGEFVVNARSARDFFPQLQAINAGQQPVYREQGGSVTTVGDIHVTVQGGESSSQTVREIATGLRRELRRKTARLF